MRALVRLWWSTPEVTTGQFLRRLGQDVKPYWPVLLLGVLALALAAVTEPALVAGMKWLLDEGFKPQANFSVWWVPAALISLFVMRGIGTFGANFCMHWLSNRLMANLRLRMFDKVLRLPTTRLDNESTAKYVSLLSFEVVNVTHGVGSVVSTLVRDTLVVLGLMSWLLYLNWHLTLVTLAVIPAVGLLIWSFTKRIRSLSKESIGMVSDLTQSAEEAIANHKVVKIYGGQAHEMQRFGAVAERLRNFLRRLTVAQGLQTPITQILAAFALSAVLVIAMGQVRADQTTLGGFVSFITAMLMLLTPLKHLADLNGQLQRAVASGEVVYGLIDQEAEQDLGRIAIGRAAGELEFRDVSLTYPQASNQALQAVSFTAKPGTVTALVGTSGGGKTSIANLIPRFHLPTGGEILLDGVALSDLTLASLRHNIALVSQEVMLFNASIADNIAYGAQRSCSREQIVAAAKAAYLEEFVQGLEAGLETEIGERGVKLSGGQRQRLAIARAILKDAPILILDEATSALDTESERYVQQALESLMKGRTTLVIAHRLSTIQHADQILVLSRGQIVERGTHAQLIAVPGVYSGLFTAGSATNAALPT
jgi:ATP-binding cassette, subfamily B, bacterial MsbA